MKKIFASIDGNSLEYIDDINEELICLAINDNPSGALCCLINKIISYVDGDHSTKWTIMNDIDKLINANDSVDFKFLVDNIERYAIMCVSKDGYAIKFITSFYLDYNFDIWKIAIATTPHVLHYLCEFIPFGEEEVFILLSIAVNKDKKMMKYLPLFFYY